MADREQLFNRDEIRRIRQEKARWYRETVKGNDGGNDYVTDSGIPVNLIYSPDDIADFDYLKESG
ncbi:MAG: methylmalonyl-CoA mutase, partial [Kyrpidia sp.]|nr:methylmalonyl-CoA mutase [Kyrpidia sp.]